ncbi:MAG: DUF1957 domain-containing protein [Chloroflexia bacterium]|nr:DUF1957 domain-containing protein [Chloroflexia bacterium]
MSKGYFTFVLHAHMPYVRQPGQDAHGELPLHEAIAESYIPLLNACYDLRKEEVPFRLTVALPPILVEQLADVDVLDRFESLLVEKKARIAEDVEQFRSLEARGEDERASHLLYLARFYVDWYDNILESFRERFGRDLVAAFRMLQDEGLIEIITAPATHAYLPLLARDSSLYAQIKMGVTSYLRHFGRLPRGFWLPECGYRPACRDLLGECEALRPGLEEFLAELNLRYTFVPGQMIEDLESVLPQSRLRSSAPAQQLAGPPTVFRPYLIQSSNVAVFGCDERAGRQVWLAQEGYPGDYVYREFARRAESSGLHYWRISGEQVPLEEKCLYDPYQAFRQAQRDAAHFGQLICEHLRGYQRRGGEPGIVVASYAAELLGYGWFEGILWLKEVLLQLSRQPDIRLTTAGAYLKEHPPCEAIALPEVSPQEAEGPFCWVNPATVWMWPLIHEAERRMELAVARFPDADGDRLEVLKQAARELLLLQCGDWPFWVGTQQGGAYAARRFQEHLARFNRLLLLLDKEILEPQDRRLMQEYQYLDNPFLNMDYRFFAARGEQAGPLEGI